MKASYGGSTMWKESLCRKGVLVIVQWIGHGRDGLIRKIGLDVRQARRIVQDRSERRGF